jgi:ankyrin repeat protein
MVKLLLQYDNIDVEGEIYCRTINKNCTLLMIACCKRNMEIVKLLVEAGADVNAYKENTTPLKLVGDNFEIIKFLKEHGAKE